MKLIIDIPEEFEQHFLGDRFDDSLQRVRRDVQTMTISDETSLSGTYEIELLDMLIIAFEYGTPFPKGHGRLIDADETLKAIDTWDKFGYTETGCFVRNPKNDYVPYVHYEDMVTSISNAPTIIDGCEIYTDKCCTAHTMGVKALYFSEWVANEIFSDEWEVNKDSFEELACRKLEKIGIVKKLGNEWVLNTESDEINKTYSEIEDAPTIIEADKEEKDADSN